MHQAHSEEKYRVGDPIMSLDFKYQPWSICKGDSVPTAPNDPRSIESLNGCLVAREMEGDSTPMTPNDPWSVESLNGHLVANWKVI